MSDAEELLVGIGEAVAGMDDRLAAVEAVMVETLGIHGSQETPPKRRPLRARAAGGGTIRHARRGRGDAASITWTVWNIDQLEPQQRETAFVQLRVFVDWVNREYQLPLSTLAITPCWYHHPGVVRELWALLASYQSAYSVRFAKEVELPTESPLLWHERTLWPCLRRLREEHGLSECVASKKHTVQVHIAITTDDRFMEDVTKLAAEWGRPDGTHEPAHRQDTP